MKPVVRLDVKIVQVRKAKAGDSVGYGGEFKLSRDSRLAVISAGYADGIPRASGSTNERRGIEAVVAGKRCPTVGRVSMDLIVIDVTDLPEGAVKRGDLATLLGPERTGNGVVIRENGLVLTIGYLVTEAETVWLATHDGRKVSGHVLAFDQETGFGLVQALSGLDLPALSFDQSSTAKVGEQVVVAGAGGPPHAVAAKIVAQQK